MRYFQLLLALACIFLLTDCVTRARYDELQATLQYYKTEASFTDSVSYANERISSETSSMEGQLEQLTMDIERLKATNISLNRSYQDILGRYNELVEKSDRVLTDYGEEKTDLQQDLAIREAKLNEKEQALYQMTLSLQEKENQLLRIRGGSPNPAQPGSYDYQGGGVPLVQARLADRMRKLQQVKIQLAQALSGYTGSDYALQDRNGQLVLTLSQNVLFGPMGNQVTNQGLEITRLIANILRQYPEMPILVKGHTDPDGNAELNWDYSTARALAVVKLLNNSGVNPSRMTAAGRSYYEPIVPNSSPANKALNRRTEIILLPDYDALLSPLTANN